jgi:hypothetical protein
MVLYTTQFEQGYEAMEDLSDVVVAMEDLDVVVACKDV